MGSTIRRQPLSFKIPDEPDYQFLNVLNFNGLNMTDNPFTADVTTASDCLNVYVDEANALTTRPRLELFYDLHKQHPGMTKLLGVYPLSIGYLFYYIENGSYALDIAYEVSNTLTFVNVDTLTHKVNPKADKLSVFEQNDKIYILSGVGYYSITYTIVDGVIVRAEIDNVKGYVPTTRVGKSNNQEGSVFEDLNILSDKYKESYFWDGTWDVSDNAGDYVASIQNNYVKKDSFTTNHYTIMKYLPNLRDALNVGSKFLAKNSSNIGVYYTPLFDEKTTARGFSPIVMPEDLPTYYRDFTADANSDGSCIALMYLSESSGPTSEINGGLYVRKNNKWYTVVLNINNYFNRDRKDFQYVKISEDGELVFAVSLNNAILCKYNKESDVYDVITDKINDSILVNQKYQIRGFKASDDCSCVVVSLQTNDLESVFWIYKNLSKQTTLLTHEELTNTKYIYGMGLTSDGNDLIIPVDNELRHYYNFKINNDYRVIKSNRPYLQPSFYADIRLHVSSNNDKIYYLVQGYTGWIMLNDEYTTVEVQNLYSGHEGMNQSEQQAYATTDSFYYLDEPTVMCSKFDFNSTEPLLLITKKITDNLDWSERRQKFLKSLLTTRFNNERWFASGNVLYYTSYNDPAYISLYNYNDLGDSDEDITGFNLADDSTLIVYKDNRVHSVRYGEVGENVYTYVYLDSPNTVGNNAFGGSIVSILTEMPLQISYDGIYALRQLTNVQSSGRISELISEGINKKWLKESKEIIKNCKTINRLYWTYFILSEKDYSKIYLLDNRTQSWYYWELPISISNAFVKNNTTYFSDTEGNLYVLKTTDLFNKFNPEITEYYDEGKKLIKWNWKSQILPMKTINYSKKLVSTTFIMSDTDEKDEYGLTYKFKAFRKTASQTQETTLTNNINYIVSTTKRTLVPRFNFIQIELSNIEGTSDDFDHNKLRLIGLAFKYVLLEGLV